MVLVEGLINNLGAGGKRRQKGEAFEIDKAEVDKLLAYKFIKIVDTEEETANVTTDGESATGGNGVLGNGVLTEPIKEVVKDNKKAKIPNKKKSKKKKKGAKK